MDELFFIIPEATFLTSIQELAIRETVADIDRI